MSLGLSTGRSRLAACLTIILLGVTASLYAADPAGLADLAGPLRTLALSAESGTISSASAAKSGVRMQGKFVWVNIYFRSPAGAAATNLSQYGVRTERRGGREVQAMVPADQLVRLAALPQVAQIAPPVKALPLQGYGGTVSQGVTMTNAQSMQLNGFTGQNVKVAVVDEGFLGLDAEVPVVASDIVNYRSDNNAFTTAHGTAVAQIVADMAPDCDMTLVAADSALSIDSAVTYLISTQVQVVVMSLGFADGPFDGTHRASQAVNRAREAGIFWVNAAGNWAQQHWSGIAENTDDDSYVELDGSTDELRYDLPVGAFQVYLSWYMPGDGGETANDFDIVLFDSTGTREITRSAVTQNGDDPPQEQLWVDIRTAGQYVVRIQYVNANLPAESEIPAVKLQYFSPNFDIASRDLRVGDESLAVPAEATGAYAVGAVRGTNLIVSPPATPELAAVQIDHMEPFSSYKLGVGTTRGKPDILAPDAVTIGGAAAAAGYGLNPFMGTSAAAPHVAGAVALLLSEDSARAPSTLQSLLKVMARKYTIDEYQTEFPDIDEGNDTPYAGGRLSLRVGQETDDDLPVIVIDFPLNNSTITSASPRVIATLSDSGEINWDTFVAKYDGKAVVKTDGTNLVAISPATDLRVDHETGQISFVLSNLTRTRHQVSMMVSDQAGNPSKGATVYFRVATPSIAAGLHIIALPYPDLSEADPAVVFGVPLENMSLLRWVPTDSRSSKYHLYPDEFAGFAPPDNLVAKPPAGLGYFLSLRTTGMLSVTANGLTDASYDIKLIYGSDQPKGWNLIGNPYEDNVDWGSVEFVSANGRQDLREAMDSTNSPVTEGVLYDFVSNAGGGYYDFPTDPTEDTLAPLKGYWLHVRKDATLVVHNTSTTAQIVATRQRQTTAKPVQGTTDNWLLQLQARAGKYEDPINYIGVSAAATDGYDLGVDVSEPPPLVDALRMYIPNSEGTLAKDVRSAASTKQEWDVEVSCRLKDVPVTVSWPRLNASLPRGLSMRMEDLDSGNSVYMRTATGYTFTMAEPGVRHLRITASDQKSTLLTVNSVSSASARGGQVMFTYSVTRQSNVSVEIRNISGMLIGRVAERSVAAGTSQTAVWNGCNERGLKAPSGRYLARITARAEDGQTVQAIHPFSVTR
ncbi:MAG: S8 family serine peptidase [Armatimonadia bacterium]